MTDIKIKVAIRECPVCKCSTGEILHEQSFILTAGCHLPSSYHILSCTSCGFVYADTPALQEDYDMYYRLNSKYEDDKVATGGFARSDDISRLLETANDLAQYIKPDDSILDLGCANGGLLLALKNNGYKNLTGIDPSVKCVDNVRSAGITAYEGSIFDNEFLTSDEPAGKFDCIILSHVLEHVRDLETALINCRNLLNDNGLICIEVPNAAKYTDYYVVPYYYFDCEHINHFSYSSMNNLLSRFGFKMLFAKEKELTVAKDRKYPALFMIFQKSAKDTKVKDEILKYVRMSSLDSTKQKIDELYSRKDSIILWGAGSYTLRLLSDTNLSKCNIMGIVDNDSNKHGKSLSGFTIYPPSKQLFQTYKIVICSALHSDEIIEQIRSMDLDNDITVI